MTVRELLASIGDQDDDTEIFIVTSSDGTHLDGRVELAFIEELPMPDGRRVLAAVPRYAVSPHAGVQPMLRLARADEDTQPTA
jgi:hypothetical protein